MTPEQIAALIAGLAGFGGLGTLGWRLVRAGWRFARRVDDFLTDWFGEPARDGRDAQPGVMARLQVVERRVERVESEVVINAGQSLKDSVVRIERHLGLRPTNRARPE